MESFSRNGVGVDNKEVISTRREKIVSGQVLYLGKEGNGSGLYYADYLTCANANQEISGCLGFLAAPLA